MKLAWKHYPIPATGEGRGYLTAAFNIYTSLKERGDVELFDCGPGGLTPDGGRIHNKAVLHFCPPHMFIPVEGKNNILFSMWETDVVPPDIVPFLAAADVRIVPSRYCQAVFANHGLDSEVAPLGIIDALASVDGSRSTISAPGVGRRRRFLFVGSRSLRKGWPILSPAWRMAFERNAADVQLYIKTIADDSAQRTVREEYDGHVVIDQRDLDVKELCEVYLSADVFLFPSFGEGFGLPALEAMALGCLVIAPETGGLTEFVGDTTALVLAKSGTRRVTYGVNIMAKVPTPGDLVPLLRIAYDSWGTPQLEAIRNNGMRVARKFTWGSTAARIAEIAASLQPSNVVAFKRATGA